MKSKMIMVSAGLIGFLMCSVSIVSAAIVYEQEPVSWSHSNNNYSLIADDFLLDEATAVTSIDWWGKFDVATTYQIIIYENVYDSANGNYEPGEALSTFKVSDVSKNEYDTDCFIFSADISFTALAGTTYWVSIAPTDATGWTGWRPASSSSVSYLSHYTKYDAASGEWSPYAGNDSHLDLAFRLNGSPVPVPSAFLLLASGLLGLAGIRRK